MSQPPPAYDLTGKRVYVAGHNGMVGSALVRRLSRENCDVVTVGRDRLDLRRQSDVEAWFADTRPDLVFLAAAKVGGILANRDYPGEFLYDNLMIEANVIESARRTSVEKLVFLGSSCIYPKLAQQPIPEEALLSGPLEPTNEAYAVAKIAGIKMAQAYHAQYACRFISAQPTNLYGPGDNFDLRSSHVLPALIRKTQEAKVAGSPQLEIWGTGEPRREFLHVDDLADALVFLAHNYNSPEIINVGSGDEVSISDLAKLIAEEVGFRGGIRFDATKPDGTPRKLLNLSRLTALGWRRSIPLAQGISSTYAWYLAEGTARGGTASVLEA